MRENSFTFTTNAIEHDTDDCRLTVTYTVNFDELEDFNIELEGFDITHLIEKGDNKLYEEIINEILIDICNENASVYLDYDKEHVW